MIRWVLLLTLIVLSTGCAARRVGVYTDDPPRRLATDGVVIDELKFEKTPLIEALALVAEKTGLTIDIDAQTLEAAGIEMNAPVTVHARSISVKEALELVGSSAAGGVTELGVDISEHYVRLTTEEALPARVPGHVYDLRHIVSAGMERRWDPRIDPQGTHDIFASRELYLDAFVSTIPDPYRLIFDGPPMRFRIVGETIYISSPLESVQRTLRAQIDAAAKQLGVAVRETAVRYETPPE